MSKSRKILIIVTGLIILTIIILGIVYYINYSSNPNRYGHGKKNSGAKVRSTFVNSAGDTLVFQGIEYSEPINIPQSDNYFIVVYPKAYAEGYLIKRVKWNEVMGADIKENFVFNYKENEKVLSFSDGANILFLNSSLQSQYLLLDRKAEITYLYMFDDRQNNSKLPNYITYLIAFNDDDKNGFIDANDKHDLYISDLSGKNLTKVTENINLRSVRYINSRTDILITYVDRDGKKEEYQRKKFAIYNIANKTFRELTDISQALDESQNILNKK